MKSWRFFNNLLTERPIRCRTLPFDRFLRPLTFCFLPVFQVVLVGSSVNERDQMLFISTDEGSSFQRQSIAFTPDTLIFHPKEEDKLLAYCKEGRVGITQTNPRSSNKKEQKEIVDVTPWNIKKKASAMN